ncbi:uncharacterized protein LOC127813337 isoform X2 [Diospyros lotus]|uniref:uncharacterized protein LOC127813337 isoform X2 n=1 Tax=Diospyros lotus TaxID=55363 RepID=UPI00224DD131|nr:uncharacterized protein LOC127813337 isoform X2 [Diospyros lotus]
MFKSGRWRGEKNKTKVVFRLQFHATQLPQVGENALMIFAVPADVGKPTARLEKAAIQDGSCHWEHPVEETVKFFREPKTGRIREKIYNLIVSTRSSKAGLLGEVSIDLASYAEATKLSSVSLPLNNSKSNGVLHVSIQRLQENTDQSEAEETENEKVDSTNRTLRAQFSIGDAYETVESNSTEDQHLSKAISHIAELNNCLGSSGTDLTISSSGSSSGLDTPREFGLKNTDVCLEETSFLSSVRHVPMLQETTSDVSITVHEEQQRSQWEWLAASAPEASTDDSSSSPGEKSQVAAELVIEKLKAELAALSRQAEMSDLELQTLRKQVVRETKKGQDLFREVVNLKEERDALEEECKNLKAFKKRKDEAKAKNKLKFEDGDPHSLLEELREELSYEKDLNSNLQIQLQKTQESNSELILAVRDLDEMLEQKNREIFNLSNISTATENGGEWHETNSKSETDDDEEQKALEELVNDHIDAKEAHVLEEKITDLYDELEICRRDKDELEMQMEQLVLDYEILKQENHDLSYKLEQSQLQEQLKMQYECSPSYTTANEFETLIESLESQLKKTSNELSNCLATISNLEAHANNLEEELDKQAQGFEADLEILSLAKVEQEQRAMRAEEALRTMRWKNVNRAERLQEEFRMLWMQMESDFRENEKLATKALQEASELQLRKSHLEELLQRKKEELQSVRDQCEVKLHELSTQISLKVDQIEEMQSEIKAKSNQLEDGKKKAEDTHRVLSQEMLMLRTEIDRLQTENKNLSDEVEEREILKGKLEQMTISNKETGTLLQRANIERNEMKTVIDLLEKEAEKSMEELIALRNLKDEKESVIGDLQLELETLKSQCDELKFEGEMEKEKLRNEVSQLKDELKKTAEACSYLENKLKDDDSGLIGDLQIKIQLLEGQINLKETALETSTNSFLEKEKDLQNRIQELETRLEELSHGATFYEVHKVANNSGDSSLNGSTDEGDKPMIERDEWKFDKLLNEMELLRERNKSMESDLKEMQERYSEISLKFAEVEGERQQLVMKVRSLKSAKSRQ